jgi:hypothetical protein
LAQVFRPASGFIIQVAEGPKAWIEEKLQENDRFEDHWKDVLDRLRMTGHREGKETPDKPGIWVIKVQGNRFAGISPILIRFTIVGDTLTINLVG